MSGYVLIRADTAATLVRDDPLVPASDVPALTDIQAVLDAAARLRDDARTAANEIADVAREEARAAGRAEGIAAGQAEVREELLRLVQADAARAEAQRGDLARLGLEVVRRIAGDLGSPEMVAALADRAAAALAPEPVPVVKVHPDAVETVRARLSSRAAVEADATLDATDCVLVTPLGAVRAGLETQLAQLARAWGIEA